MSSSTPMHRALAPVIALATALILVPSVARAHIALRSTEPAAGSTISAPPRFVTLRFSARPQVGFSRIVLVGPGGELPLQVSADSARALMAAVPADLVPGRYTVRWQTASGDGHVIQGEFAFILTAPATSGATDASPVKPPAAGHDMGTHVAPAAAHARHPQYHWARWLEFVALVTILGVLGFQHAVLPPLAARSVPTADASQSARRLGQRMVGLYVFAAAWRLYAESVAVHGAQRALDAWQLWFMVTRTTWGTGWLIGVGAAVLVFTGWRLSRRSVAIGTPLALLGGLALAVAPALTGHAAAQQPLALGIAADALHVLAAGMWTGGVLVLLLAGLPAMKRVAADVNIAIAALVNSFHPLALFCAVLVVISGVTSSWMRLGALDALWSTTYGRTLIVKLCLVVLVIASGFYNSVRARRRLGTAEGTRRIGITAAIELGFVALVLAVTTVLVATPLPGDAP